MNKLFFFLNCNQKKQIILINLFFQGIVISIFDILFNII